MNVHIVNIDTSDAARKRNTAEKIKIIDNNAKLGELFIQYNDALDLHDHTIYVLRKDNHYDMIYRERFFDKFTNVDEEF